VLGHLVLKRTPFLSSRTLLLSRPDHQRPPVRSKPLDALRRPAHRSPVGMSRYIELSNDALITPRLWLEPSRLVDAHIECPFMPHAVLLWRNR